ncbi:hypothetical protein NI17_009985 [Thermobifida halotolerans]|uniref:Uncharacterized protein n=1 Tax=Thermobifida halotolerans TaxID=483545 RepID=A0AA97M5W1_9ACTN|nr:hypothetical protein [Thermobifida halotolerans]UOE21407.1 hypothetical protein NI17_009985 [Thermobifida halotolerans]
MGSGGSHKHTTYATAPTADAVLDAGTGGGVVASGQAAGEDDLAAAVEAIDMVNGVLSEGPAAYAVDHPTSDLEDWYAAVSEAVAHADTSLILAEESGAPADAVAAVRAQLKQASSAALASLTAEELQQLAAAHGFQHAGLVGLNHQPGQPHALAHWLDPVYPGDSVSKAKIQAKALERYHALCAGQDVPGVTLADADPPAGSGGTWQADPAQFSALNTHFNIQVAAYHALALGDTEGRADVLADLVATGNRISTATVPGADADAVAASQGAAQGQLDEIINALPVGSAIPDKALDQAQQAGLITAQQRTVLDRAAALLLVREGVPAELKETTAELAEQRLQQLADLESSYTALHPFLGDGDGLVLPSHLHPVKDPDTLTQVAAFAQAAQVYTQAESDIAVWDHTTPGGSWAALTSVPINDVGSGYFTPKFEAWAVGKNTGALKQVAAELGLHNAEAANKALAKKFIAAHWDPHLDKNTIQAQVDAKAAQAAQTGQAAASQSAAVPASTNPPPAAKPSSSRTGFLGKHAALVQALKQHGAAASALPPRLDPAVVNEHDFGKGVAAHGLGGMHSKSLHTGPDGGQWLFKPDQSAQGARAHGEAAASAIYDAAGIPAVPVYTATVDGKKGVVQPMVKGAKPLSGDVKSWSQADVDALVRTHVAAWVMGDHDGHVDNILKTPSGGLIPIDAGQAFKYYGQDTLSLKYAPNPTPAAYQKAYQAALSHHLAKGVRIRPAAAHPVIKKIESIPDAQWRAMLRSTAYEGAQRGTGVHWVATMRKRAAHQHTIPESAVTPAQIAEAFLDHAVERKNTLRETFADFFTSELELAGAAALKYGA